jgi:5-dehydro-2-deoxygluconokinase
LNVLGAGDAFLSGFLRGWVRGEPLENCALYANACGALVVSRHGCSPAMPSKLELDDYIARRARVPRIDQDERIAHLHRTTTRERQIRELCVLAFDHRASFEKIAERAGAPVEKIAPVKLLIAEAAARAAKSAGLGAGGRPDPGMIIDDRFGREALYRFTGAGFWLARPIERPSEPNAPLELEGAPNPELGLLTWPKEQVIKCLAFYHPDGPEEARRGVEEQLLRLYRAAVTLDRELLVEIIPQLGDRAEPEALPRALGVLYSRGVRPDWWKLPPPKDDATWEDVGAVIAAHDPQCRGVLLLGLDAPEEELARAFRGAAGHPICKGFAVGRTIFGAASEKWLSGAIGDGALIRDVALAFERMIEIWIDRGEAK